MNTVDLQVASGEMCESGGTCRALTPLEASVVIGGEAGMSVTLEFELPLGAALKQVSSAKLHLFKTEGGDNGGLGGSSIAVGNAAGSALKYKLPKLNNTWVAVDVTAFVDEALKTNARVALEITALHGGAERGASGRILVSDCCSRD